jgi:arabinogalactan oligomer/maltooligosaccharide transport system permease protein
MFDYEYGAINLMISKYLSLPMVNWLGSPLEAFLACVLTNIWLGFPFMMVISLGGLQGIPQELYEAARIDGASRISQFFHITLPLLKPVLAPAVTLGSIWTFNNLNVVWLVSNGGEPSDKTHILVSYVYKAVFNLYRYGYGAALSMVIFFILLGFSLVFLRRTRATQSIY